MLNALCKYILIAFVIFTQPLLAQRVFVLDSLSARAESADLFSYVYIADPDNGKFNQIQALFENLPINKSYQLFLVIENKTNDTVKKVIEFGGRYVTANTISHMLPGSSIRKNFGSALNNVQILIAPREKSVIFFEMKELNRADPKRLSVYLYNPDTFRKKIVSTHGNQLFFLGLFLFLFLFNLIVHFVTSWVVYLKYAIYIFSAFLYFSYYFGLLQEVFPFVKALPINVAYTWYSLIFITYFYFLNDFGDYKKYVPKAYLLLNIGIVFKIVESVINTFLHLLGYSFIYSKIYVNTVLGLEIVLMGLILFYILKNKNTRGRLVVLGSFMLILTAIIEQTQLFPNLDRAYFVEAGIVAELLTFSVGLGYVTKLYYEEKRSAEQLYVQQLIANEKLQKENTEKLEALVLQRTEELNAEKKLVEKKNSENEVLLGEIHHRVKNNLQVISSLLSLQEKSISNASARNAIKEGKERIRSMELVHKMLYRADSFSGIEMKEYIEKLSEGLIDSFGKNGQSEVLIAFTPTIVDVDTAISLGLILNELIVNALKHGRPTIGKLQVQVELLNKRSKLFLKVTDNGNGKLANVQTTDSFGMRIVEALVRQLNGDMEISEEKGLQYSIVFKKNNFELHEN